MNNKRKRDIERIRKRKQRAIAQSLKELKSSSSDCEEDENYSTDDSLSKCIYII